MNARYVKLPNDEIVRVNENDFIRVVVSVELSEIINNDLEGFLDILSEKATGTEVLSDITYSIVERSGSSTLEIEVVGNIDLIETEDIELEALPMLEFEVQVCRVGFGSRTTRLSARISEEARENALDAAGNHTYSETSSEYSVQVSLIG